MPVLHLAGVPGTLNSLACTKCKRIQKSARASCSARASESSVQSQASTSTTTTLGPRCHLAIVVTSIGRQLWLQFGKSIFFFGSFSVFSFWVFPNWFSQAKQRGRSWCCRVSGPLWTKPLGSTGGRLMSSQALNQKISEISWTSMWYGLMMVDDGWWIYHAGLVLHLVIICPGGLLSSETASKIQHGSAFCSDQRWIWAFPRNAVMPKGTYKHTKGIQRDCNEILVKQSCIICLFCLMSHDIQWKPSSTRYPTQISQIVRN